jgi:hypothetical protein
MQHTTLTRHEYVYVHAGTHTHRIEEEIRLETRRIALVAKTHRLQISILDKRALVRTAMATI